MRIAHYVRSSHWDREWYETFQGFRMRLVAVLDEVLDSLSQDETFTYCMDGQSIPISDYLEVRPENLEKIRRFCHEGRLIAGPWYVAPDEWLVSGESLIRNLQMGIEVAESFGGKSSRAGFACDQFGHIGQLPQIFDQLGITGAFVWRGTNHKGAHFLWRSPDGTTLPTYCFGPRGYGMLAYQVRNLFEPGKPLDVEEALAKLIEYTKYEAERTKLAPILLFDGADHLEIEPRMSEIIARANEQLSADKIRIVPSDLDKYLSEISRDKSSIDTVITGEFRDTGRDPAAIDEQWLIAGCYSSRIHLKQRNAVCEDELCLWAEPFSTFASESLGAEYPSSFLRLAWKHLLENHPHDSICGCSIDAVHQDMIYRFDQSIGISSRLAEKAMQAIALAAAQKARVEGAFSVGVFNATSETIDEPVDIDFPFPKDWKNKFSEFFGFEEKFAFNLRGPDGKLIPCQIVHQRRDAAWFRREIYKFPEVGTYHIVTVAAKLHVPEFGYAMLQVEPAEPPTRYLGTMMPSHRSIENEFLRITVNPNGTLLLNDKRTGKTFDQLLTFEDRADIGDGWFHGVAVNDEIYTSAASAADVAVIADGPNKSTLRISITLNVPVSFDFQKMVREPARAPLRIKSEITLRSGVDRVEVMTRVHNTVLDHRLRVLFPTGIQSETYLSDSTFDVVERPVALVADNAIRRELDIETRPQISWIALGDGKAGLAIVSRGLPESAVINTPDRPIALTLLRGFRRAVFTDGNPGGQIQGEHIFRYNIVPFASETPIKKLFLLGQRVNTPIRQIVLPPTAQVSGKLPPEHSFAAMKVI